MRNEFLEPVGGVYEPNVPPIFDESPVVYATPGPVTKPPVFASTTVMQTTPALEDISPIFNVAGYTGNVPSDAPLVAAPGLIPPWGSTLLQPTTTTGPINNPIINEVQSVVPSAPVVGSAVPANGFGSLLNLFDALTSRTVPAATPANPQGGIIVVPGSSDTGGTPASGSNYTGLLLIVAVVGLLITFIVYRKKIISEVKSAV